MTQKTRGSRAKPKLMFVGKFADYGSEKDFRRLGLCLGFAAAASGAEIVVGSDSPSTLDANVVRGAAMYGRETGKPVSWRVYAPSDGKSRYAQVPTGLREPVRETFESPVRWQAAHLEAVRTVDAVVSMGGHDNTHRACIAADARGRSVWPVPMFGGAAQRVFLATVARAKDRHAEEVAATGADFSLRSWKDIANRFIERIVRSLSAHPPKPRRAYFLSYASENKAAADQVELFLRRKDRGVVRDEVDFPPGANLEESMRMAILSTDDFIVLDSKRSAASVAVRFEIDFASSLKHVDQKRDRRLIGLLLEGMPPKTALDPAALHLKAKTRLERTAAVERIMDTEGQRRIRGAKP